MTLRSRAPDLLAVGLLAGSALAGVVLWPRLPAEMAIHFDAGGEPDTFVARPIAVLLGPAIGVVAVGIVRLSTRLDPTVDPRALAATVAFVGAVVAYVQGLLLAYNLGHGVSIPVALVPVLVAAGALTLYALRRDGPL